MMQTELKYDLDQTCNNLRRSIEAESEKPVLLPSTVTPYVRSNVGDRPQLVGDGVAVLGGVAKTEQYSSGAGEVDSLQQQLDSRISSSCALVSSQHQAAIIPSSWLDVISSSVPSSLSLMTAHKSAPSHISTYPLSSSAEKPQLMQNSLNFTTMTVNTTPMLQHCAPQGVFQPEMKPGGFPAGSGENQFQIFNSYHQSESANTLEALSQPFSISFPNLELATAASNSCINNTVCSDFGGQTKVEDIAVINMDQSPALPPSVCAGYPSSASTPLSSCVPTPSSTPATFARLSSPVTLLSSLPPATRSQHLSSSSTSPHIVSSHHQFVDSLAASPRLNQSIENIHDNSISLISRPGGEASYSGCSGLPANFTSCPPLPDNGQNLAALQRYIFQDLHSQENRNQTSLERDATSNFGSSHAQHRMTRLVPPPLHPSPAVLLHIQYVMDSVSSAMFFTDVSIVTRCGVVRAHRSVLSAHSNFLASLLMQQIEEDEYYLNLPDYSSEHIKLLLQFLYKGEAAGMTQDDISPLRDICVCFRIYSLVARLDELMNVTMSMQHPLPGQDKQVLNVVPDNQCLTTSLKQNKSLSDSLEIHSDIDHQLLMKCGKIFDGSADASCDGTADPSCDGTADASCDGSADASCDGTADPSCDGSADSRSGDTGRETRRRQPSCQYQLTQVKTKSKSTKFSIWPVRQFTHTVVSKMPKDTTLQTSKKCPKCSLKFFNKETFDNHLKLHNGEKFECSVCGKSISSKYHLNIHMQTHTNKKYPCSVPGCDKQFSDPSAVRRHNRKKHQQVESHSCNKCDVTFTSRSALERHQADQHSPKGQYITCDSCTKKFRCESQLVRHKKRVHKENMEQTNKKTEQEKREDLMKKNSCQECGALFRKPYDLKLHRRVHTGEKPYKCTMCDKWFARTYNLQLHLRTHTGEKPHACAQCGKCFSDVAAFRRHCRTHTGTSLRPFEIST